MGRICVDSLAGSTCGPWWAAAGLVVGAIVVLAVPLLALVLLSRRTPLPSQVAAQANRHATLASVAGVAMLVALLLVVALTFLTGIRVVRDGRVMAALPALAGACLLVAQAIGQLTWPRPEGARREAALVRREVADVAPLVPRRLVLGWAGAVVVSLAVFATVADGPRSLRRVGGFTEAIGPYPGSYYAMPLTALVVALVLGTEAVLRLITTRSAVTGVSHDWDLHLRRRCARHVTRGVQLVLAVTLAGVLTTAAWAHLAVGRASELPERAGDAAQHALGATLLIAALCVLVAGLATAVAPTRRRWRPAAGVPDAVVAS